MSDLLGWLISFGIVVGIITLWYLNSLWHTGILVEGRIEAHLAPKTEAWTESETVYRLVYSFDYNHKNYAQEGIVRFSTYNRLKDGDRVNARVSPGDPTHSLMEEY